jgi:hypothetical protein
MSPFEQPAYLRLPGWLDIITTSAIQIRTRKRAAPGVAEGELDP